MSKKVIISVEQHEVKLYFKYAIENGLVHIFHK